MWCLDLHLSLPPISRFRKSRLWEREGLLLSCRGPGYYPQQWVVLNRYEQGKQCNQSKSCGRGTQLITPTDNPFLIPPGHHLFFIILSGE
jgi:hypothetical protein